MPIQSIEFAKYDAISKVVKGVTKGQPANPPATTPRDYTKPFGTACHFCDQIEHPKDDGPVPGVGCRFCHLGHCSSSLQHLGGPGCVCMKEHPFGTGGDQGVKFDFPFSWGKKCEAAEPPALASEPDEEESVWKG